MSNMTISIRHAIPSDAADIADIYNEAIRWTTATFDTELKSAEERLRWLEAHDERHPVLVAEIGEQVVGWAALTKWSDRPAYDQTAESSFYVAQPFRGRGIGRALKRRLIEEARRLGFHTILARVAEGSEASIHVNESFGFKHIGTMKEVGLKFGRRLDVHLMQLMLDKSEDASGIGSTATVSGNGGGQATNAGYRIVVVDDPAEAEQEAINSVLREHNRNLNPAFWAALDDPANSLRPLNVVARTGEEIVGGLLGQTQFLWLKIGIVSVVERLQRQGVGSAILAAAEAEAVCRGCKYAYVDTMEYQSPAFYQRLGYRIVGRLDDWDSHGHTKYLLSKALG